MAKMKLKFTEVVYREYSVWNKKEDLLGTIVYDEDWKCWIWFQEEDIQMSLNCLKQVTNFMEKLK